MLSSLDPSEQLKNIGDSAEGITKTLKLATKAAGMGCFKWMISIILNLIYRILHNHIIENEYIIRKYSSQQKMPLDRQ